MREREGGRERERETARASLRVSWRSERKFFFWCGGVEREIEMTLTKTAEALKSTAAFTAVMVTTYKSVPATVKLSAHPLLTESQHTGTPCMAHKTDDIQAVYCASALAS